MGFFDGIVKKFTTVKNDAIKTVAPVAKAIGNGVIDTVKTSANIISLPTRSILGIAPLKTNSSLLNATQKDLQSGFAGYVKGALNTVGAGNIVSNKSISNTQIAGFTGSIGGAVGSMAVKSLGSIKAVSTAVPKLAPAINQVAKTANPVSNIFKSISSKTSTAGNLVNNAIKNQMPVAAAPIKMDQPTPKNDYSNYSNMADSYEQNYYSPQNFNEMAAATVKKESPLLSSTGGGLPVNNLFGIKGDDGLTDSERKQLKENDTRILFWAKWGGIGLGVLALIGIGYKFLFASKSRRRY